MAFWRCLQIRASVLAAVLAMVAVIAVGGATGAATPDSMNGAEGTLPAGSALPSTEFCATYADRVGSSSEAVPDNGLANSSIPENLKLPPWPDFWEPVAQHVFVPRIDGQYTGTTDQIIVWGACKWGFDVDVVRAMAMAESSWRQDNVGDFESDAGLCVGDYRVPCPTSFGLLQLKHTFRPGSWPASQYHTAFNVDYELAYVRGCFEGWVTYLDSGYTAGDLSGCVGWHYDGEWKEDLGLGFVRRVERELQDKRWADWS